MSQSKDYAYSDEETVRRRDAALLRALDTPHKRQKDMKAGARRNPSPETERLTRDGIAWLEFLRSPAIGKEVGGPTVRMIVLFGQYLNDVPHQNGDVGVIDDFLLYEKLQQRSQHGV